MGDFLYHNISAPNIEYSRSSCQLQHHDDRLCSCWDRTSLCELKTLRVGTRHQKRRFPRWCSAKIQKTCSKSQAVWRSASKALIPRPVHPWVSSALHCIDLGTLCSETWPPGFPGAPKEHARSEWRRWAGDTSRLFDLHTSEILLKWSAKRVLTMTAIDLGKTKSLQMKMQKMQSQHLCVAGTAIHSQVWPAEFSYRILQLYLIYEDWKISKGRLSVKFHTMSCLSSPGIELTVAEAPDKIIA